MSYRTRRRIFGIVSFISVMLLSSLMSNTTVFAAAPTVSGVDATISYIENAAPVVLDNNVTITGDSFADGYVRYHITNATASDVLTIVNPGDVNANGAISRSGDSIYVGVGGSKKKVGEVDATLDGLGGRDLKILLSSPMTNSGFESGNTTGWSVTNGYYPIGADSGTGISTSVTVVGNTGGVSPYEGSMFLKMSINGTTDPNGTAHGPTVTSDYFEASTGDTIALNWYAKLTSDKYDVFGYLIDDDNGGSITQLFYDRGDQTAGWQSLNTTVPRNSTRLKFMFVCGSQDATGGRAIGSEMYIDNVRVFSALANATVATNIARSVGYSNTSDKPSTTTRSFTVEVKDTNGAVATSGSGTVNVTAVPDAPTVVTGAASNLGPRVATVQGNATDDDGAAITEKGIEYKKQSEGSYTRVASGASGMGAYSVSLTGLTKNTAYDYRAYAVNSVDTSYSAPATFSTTANNAPTGSISINAGAVYAPAQVTLTLSAADSDFGDSVTGMSFSTDNSNWSAWESYAASKQYTLSGGGGPKTVYVKYRDTSSDASAAYSDSIILDSTAPTIAGVTSSGEYSSDITVTLSDGQIGLAANGVADGQNRFRTNSGAWQAMTGPTMTFSAEDSYTLEACDQAGNKATVTFLIDKTMPTATAAPSEAAWSSDPVSVSLSYADGASGVATREYQWSTNSDVTVNSGGWRTYTSAVSPSGDGEWYLYYRVTDEAGNTAFGSFGLYKLDMTAPTVQGIVNQNLFNDVYYHDGGVTPVFDFGICDLAGRTTLERKDRLTDLDWVLSDDWSNGQEITAEGAYRVSAVDGVGNQSPSHQFVIDMTSPTTAPQINVVSDQTGANVGMRMFITKPVSESDDPSEKLVYTTDGSAPDETSLIYAPGGVLFDVEGIYTVRAAFIDAAGNVGSARTLTFIVDLTDPHVSASTVGSDDWRADEVSVTLTFRDDLTGVSEQKYAWSTDAQADREDLSWVEYTGTVTNSVNDIWYLYYRATDMAENEIFGSFGPYKYDVTNPDQPAISATDAYPNGSWSGSDVTVSATAQDATSGIDLYQHSTSTDGESWSAWSSGASYTVSPGLGTAQAIFVKFRAFDNSGNLSQESDVWNVKVDKRAPVISGVSNGSHYSTDRLVNIVDDQAGVDSVTVDGSESLVWPDGLDFVDQGVYTIVAVDAVGNSSTVTFTLDKTAPVIGGVVDGSINAAPVSPVITDDNIDVVSVTKDGNDFAAWVSGNPINSDGGYTITATDRAGNQTFFAFIIDQTAPVIGGVIDGSYVNHAVSLIVTDANLYGVRITKDGQAYDAPHADQITGDGVYIVSAADDAGNQTEITFTVDRTAPSITGVENNKYYNLDVAPVVEEANLDLIVAEKGGSNLVWDSGDLLTGEGSYQINVTDKAGNSVSVAFTIDKTKPVVPTIYVHGSDDGDGLPGTSVEIIGPFGETGGRLIYTADGKTPQADGQEYAQMLHFGTDGMYTVKAIYIDRAGNVSPIATTIFAVDATPPGLSGVVNSGFYNISVVPKFSEFIPSSLRAWKYNVAASSWETLAWTNEASISDEGSYKISAADLSGNSTVATFTIDKTAPVITVTGVPGDGAAPTNQSIEVDASTNEGTLNATSYTFDANGAFTFTATDAAGNTANRTVVITNIDTEGPDITLNQYVTTPTNQDITVTATITEGTLVAGDVVRSLSQVFTANGSMTFTAIDALGNSSSTTVTITNIDKTAPEVTVTGVPDVAAAPTNQSITVTASTNEGTLNAESHTFTENGSFTFTATDAAGNTTSRTVTVTNIDKSPADNGGGSGTSPNNPPTDPNPPADNGGSGSNNSGIDVYVNGQAETAGTLTTTEENGKRVDTITVDEQKLDETLAREGANSTLLIPGATGGDVLHVKLNGQMIKNMEALQSVAQVTTESASYSLPAAQISISAISEQLGQDVQLSDIDVEIEISQPADDMVTVVEDSANAGGFAIVAPPLNFSIRCSFGGNSVEVERFNAYVERTVLIPDGVDPSKITTGIVVNPDGTTRHVPTQVVIIDGKYYAKINSLSNSTYTVVYHPTQYQDMVGHWAEYPVNDMASRMVMFGDSEDVFGAGRAITRGEFAASIVRALGLQPGLGENEFVDVHPGDQYYGYILTAHEYGIMGGYAGGIFGADRTITREEAMSMIVNAMRVTGLQSGVQPSEGPALLATYSDSKSVGSWARGVVAACLKTGIIGGRSGNTIAPKASITRAETAAIIQRLLQRSGLI